MYRGYLHKSVHRPAGARVREEIGAHGVDDCNIASINCARAIALLRYGQTELKRQSLLRIVLVPPLHGPVKHNLHH
jgi:hypothetical protein